MAGRDASRADGEAEVRKESELLARARDGDEIAFDELYRRYFPRVHGFVRRRLTQIPDVEDVVQEVFVVVFTSLAGFRGEASFASWVLGVTRKVLSQRYRKKRIETVPLDDVGRGVDAQSPEPSAFEAYRYGEQLRRLEASLADGCSTVQRDLVLAHHLEGRSLAGLASEYGCSEDAAKSTLYRARKRIAHALAEPGRSDGARIR